MISESRSGIIVRSLRRGRTVGSITGKGFNKARITSRCLERVSSQWDFDFKIEVSGSLGNDGRESRWVKEILLDSLKKFGISLLTRRLCRGFLLESNSGLCLDIICIMSYELSFLSFTLLTLAESLMITLN